MSSSVLYNNSLQFLKENGITPNVSFTVDERNKGVYSGDGDDLGVTITGITTDGGDPSSIVSVEFLDDSLNTNLENITWKQSIRVASSSNIANISATLVNGAPGFGPGITLQTGDRILLRDQTNSVENGIYIVTETDTGIPVRASDMDTGSDAKGTAILVEEGQYASNIFVNSKPNGNSTIVGQDPLTFIEYGSQSDLSAGDGIDIGLGVISVDDTVVRTAGEQLIEGKKYFSDRILIGDAFLHTEGNSNVSGGIIRFNNNIPLIIGNPNDSETTIQTTPTETSIVKTADFIDSTGDILIENQNTAENSSITNKLGDTNGMTKFNVTNSADASLLTINSAGLSIFSGAVQSLAFKSISDERKKENIKLIESSDIISNIKPVSYNWKQEYNNDSGTKFGLIAQQVKETIPEAVHENKDGFLSVDYNCIWSLLLKSHQDLAKSHKDLEQSHQDLIKKNNELSERLYKLENK